MPRSRLNRQLALSLAVWITVAVGAPEGWHHCAVHDGASHAGHMHQMAPGNAPVSGHGHRAYCSCLGQCCPAAAARISSRVVLAEAPTFAAPARPYPLASVPPLDSREPLQLTTGPPAAVDRTL